MKGSKKVSFYGKVLFFLFFLSTFAAPYGNIIH